LRLARPLTAVVIAETNDVVEVGRRDLEHVAVLDRFERVDDPGLLAPHVTPEAATLKKPRFWICAVDRPTVRLVSEISVETTADGRAYLRLGDGEVRDSVALGEHDEADRIPSLDSLVLHFDFYGRLTAIEVTGSAASVLPPGLIDD